MKIIMANGVKSHTIDHVGSMSEHKRWNVGDPFLMETLVEGN